MEADLGMHCLLLSHRKDAKLIWVTLRGIVNVILIANITCMRMVNYYRADQSEQHVFEVPWADAILHILEYSI